MVRVMTLTGATYVVDTTPNSTIRDIKMALADQMDGDYKPKEMALLLRGQVGTMDGLSDNVKVPQNSDLILIMRLKSKPKKTSAETTTFKEPKPSLTPKDIKNINKGLVPKSGWSILSSVYDFETTENDTSLRVEFYTTDGKPEILKGTYPLDGYGFISNNPKHIESFYHILLKHELDRYGEIESYNSPVLYKEFDLKGTRAVVVHNYGNVLIVMFAVNEDL